MGLANEHLNKFDDADKAYQRATLINPLNLNGWKGWLLLTEKKKDGAQHLTLTFGIIKCYESTDDLIKAVDALQKTIRFSKKHPWPSAEIDILQAQLPGSPIFHFLEGRLPPSSQIYASLAAVYEKDEKLQLSKINSKALSLRIDGKQKTSKAESIYNIYKSSKIPELYQNVINWTNDDEIRKSFEAKLLQYKYNQLEVCSSGPSKKELKDEVYEMASGMVFVNSDDLLAWKITIEWKDVVDLSDYDPHSLATFVQKFPKDLLSKVLTGFFRSEISPYDPAILDKILDKKDNISPQDSSTKLIQSDEASQLEDNPLEIENQDSNEYSLTLILDYLTEGLSDDSLLSYRILGAFYLHLREYESAVDTSRRGISILNSMKKKYNISSKNTLNHFKTILATAYIFYQAPKNHAESMTLFNQILESNKNYTSAKIGKGLIFRETQKYGKAASILQSVLEEQPDNLDVLFEYSWCLVLLCEFEKGREGMETFLESKTGEDPLSQDYRAQAWWRIGQSYWDQSEKGYHEKGKQGQNNNHLTKEELDQEIFGAFANSLKENPNYAPAYTSLGKFYAKQGDSSRASKCYYKAFELDAGELDAAEELAKEFANIMNWGLVEVVATRVLDSERVRFMGGKSLTWPSRVLGISSLNKQDYGAAVKHFQNSIRMNSKDVTSWIGLGDAYTNSGRYDAAQKAFIRAQSLDPNNWIATYNLAMVLRKMQEFNEAARIFKVVLSIKPNESAPMMALVETLLLSAKHELSREIYHQAALKAIDCIKTATTYLLGKKLPLTQDIWKVIGECCEIFLSVQSTLNMVPFDSFEKLTTTFGDVLEENENISFLTDIDNITVESVSALGSDTTPLEKLIFYCVLFFKLSLVHARKDKSSSALGWYNLGLTYLKIYLLSQPSLGKSKTKPYILASMEAFKKTIKNVNTNADVWNAYGVACSFVNSKAAQHCFIRSLVLDARQSSPWTNLAALYIRQGDLQLSDEAIEKALSSDPEFVPAWIGKGIIHYTTGNSLSARNSFRHAFEISNGTDKLSKLYYALSVFEMIQQKDDDTSKDSSNVEKKMAHELETSVLSLQKYLSLVPDSTLAMELEGLILERISDYQYALSHCTKLCDTHEKNYEETESPEDLISYVRSKAHLARVTLGAEKYKEAAEHAQYAIDISSELSEMNQDAIPIVKKTRLSAFLTGGLANYFLKNYSEAIGCFKSALEESDEDQDVVVLLAQVLWAHGGDEEREVALEQLFGSIETHGSASLNVALTLGAIGVTHDPEIIDAAQEELNGFSQQFLAAADPHHHVPLMLSAMNKALGISPALPWLKAAFFTPWNFDIWKRLDDGVAIVQASAGVGKAVSSIELSNTYIGQRDFKSIQRSIYYAPWNDQSWKALASIL